MTPRSQEDHEEKQQHEGDRIDKAERMQLHSKPQYQQPQCGGAHTGT
jgi:hypothetical protein